MEMRSVAQFVAVASTAKVPTSCPPASFQISADEDVVVGDGAAALVDFVSSLRRWFVFLKNEGTHDKEKYTKTTLSVRFRCPT